MLPSKAHQLTHHIFFRSLHRAYIIFTTDCIIHEAELIYPYSDNKKTLILTYTPTH